MSRTKKDQNIQQVEKTSDDIAIEYQVQKERNKAIWTDCIDDIQLLVDIVCYEERTFSDKVLSKILCRIRNNIHKLDPIPPEEMDIPF